jgi:hypothetical protein
MENLPLTGGPPINIGFRAVDILLPILLKAKDKGLFTPQALTPLHSILLKCEA